MASDAPLPAAMQAIVADPASAGLRLVERPVPAPGHGEVLIKIAAAGLNGADLIQRRGRYRMPPGATDILGLEAAGEIAAIGDGVAGWKKGDAVCALLVGGGYAQFVAAPAVQCLPVPKGVGVVEAAGLPECVITVWLNVFELAALRPGDRLLVHGGASGIGTTAIQLARGFGSPVYATAGSPEKCKVCEELGATLAIDYKRQDFAEALEKELGGAGIDVVLELVGGEYIMRDLAVAAQGCRIVTIATKRGAKVEIDLGAIQEKNAFLTGSRLRPRPIPEKARLVAAVRKAVWPLIEDGRFKPVIDRTFPLAEAAEAHAHMEAGVHIGKILLTV